MQFFTLLKAFVFYLIDISSQFYLSLNSYLSTFLICFLVILLDINQLSQPSLKIALDCQIPTIWSYMQVAILQKQFPRQNNAIFLPIESKPIYSNFKPITLSI